MRWVTLRRGRSGSLALALMVSLVAVPAGASIPASSSADGSGAPEAEPAVVDNGAQNDDAAAEEVESGPEAAALAEAKRVGEPVEVEERRTETAQVFANPSGTFTLEQHALPVRVRQDDEWADIDTTLQVNADGSISPVATVSPLRLSGGGDTEMVRLGQPGRSLLLGWPSKLPEPTLEGSTATYPEVLPGVDLKVTAEVDGFTQLLVVKDRKAVRLPALRRLEYPIRTDGLTLDVTDDGATVATDAEGATVFTAGAPMMWDSSAGRAASSDTAASAETLDREEAGTFAPMDLDLATASDGEQSLVIEPDADMLTSPETTFPVYVDPSFSDPKYRWWTHVNKTYPGQSYWNYDRNQGAKVGYSNHNTNERPVTYRSFFQLGGLEKIKGSLVKSTYFAITLNHSASCSLTRADLWHTKSINPADDLEWGNSGNHWLTFLATASGKANESSCSQPDMGMEFASPALKNLVQGIADDGVDHITLGLRAPNESNPDLWKRFRPFTSAIVVEYNNPPRVPSYLNFRRPLACGTAENPTPIGTAQPQFSGVASDPDNQNLTTVLEIRDASGGLAHSVRSSTTTSAAAFSWPQVPAGVLQEDVRYSYHAYSDDRADVGAAAEPCYFIVDDTDPGVPIIESSDYPNDGELVIPARTTGTVTFRPAAGDTDVAEYVYGLEQDRMTMRVNAAADGTAVVPITVWDRTGERLYVAAVDRAGNEGVARSAWYLDVKSNPDPIPHVNGDANGDGRPDVTAVLDHGFGRTAVWNIIAREDGFHTGTVAWDAGVNGGYPLFRVRPVAGDFDGDGGTDLALFREGAGRKVSLYPLISDGNRYRALAAVWTSPAPGWSLNNARFDTGDVTGDGSADIVVQLWGTDNTREILVFPGGDLSSPQVWLTESDADPDHRATPLVADVDGDARADLVSVRGQAECRTVFEMNRSTGEGFASTTDLLHDSGDGEFCWQNGKFVVADVDGDELDDVVAAYEYGVEDVGLWTFRSTKTALTPALWWRGSGEFDLGKATLTTGDFDLDDQDDLAVLYACCDDGSRQVWTFASTGDGFGEKRVDWHESTGAVAGPAFYQEPRSYELVARHSGKCVSVSGASTANGTTLIQWPCRGAQLNERYRLDPVAGTDRYEIRAVHSFKCVDVLNGEQGDGAPLVQHDCHGGANQQVTLEYVDGSSYETVVRLRFVHSGKCVNITDGSTADGTPLEQRGCGGGASQQWTLRPSVNPQLDGRFKIHAEVSTNGVLDVVNCNGQDVRIWFWVSGSPCQKWQVEPHGDDLYRILDPSSGNSLAIEGCSESDGATVRLTETNDSRCQVWRIEPSARGTYSVLAANTGKSLDVAGCNPANGAEVIIWPYLGNRCQRWFMDLQ